jgi:hypothetical protein
VQVDSRAIKGYNQFMESHDAVNCPDCVVQQLEANGHSMQMIMPCTERKAYWACLTCDILEEWPITNDIKAANEILRAFLYIHCLDNLVLSQ